MRSASHAIIALTGMLVACGDGGTAPEVSSPLALSIATATRISISDSAVLTMSLKNNSASAYAARLPGSLEWPHFRVLVRNETGDTLWFHPGGVLPLLSDKTFAPQESVQMTVVWPLKNRTGAPVDAGTYRVSATIETFESDLERPVVVRSDEIRIVVANNLR